ncbi:NADH oxidoreductase [Acerihabitans arboris]|uniref:NADH oxidoreductase n=1 Tax=Acerihabitans arboris TaxID=2691583 RepID=A0A845SGF7_9GAMM|nr:NADH oxidoreductase [Acerihabitans arboris]NDL61778.1 NADH oxidoreductase [Acerihabitans arboris]
MTMPSSLCPYRMQVHHIIQETPDVWTLALINHDVYPYQPGQFALVSVNNSEAVRAYTLSSSPGGSRFITLTVRRLEDGLGSRWLTQQVKPGDYLWLSAAQGDFSCMRHVGDRYLFLAAGCGITPVVSMCRWLAANRPQVDVQVIYCVRSPRDIIAATAWTALGKWLRLTLFAEQGATGDIRPGRLEIDALRALAPDIAERTVMACGPAPWMAGLEADARALGAGEFLQEHFHTPLAHATSGRLKITHPRPLQTIDAPAGLTLLAALEARGIAVNAACRAGVCGCCKTRIAQGQYRTTSAMTLSAQEITEGYVLACSCYPQSDIVIA